MRVMGRCGCESWVDVGDGAGIGVGARRCGPTRAIETQGLAAIGRLVWVVCFARGWYDRVLAYCHTGILAHGLLAHGPRRTRAAV